jgi:hypothetical protein
MGPKKSTFKGEGYTRRNYTNGNEESCEEESRQEEKAVTDPARHWPRLTFANNMASALAVRGGLSLCAESPRWIADGSPTADR